MQIARSEPASETAVKKLSSSDRKTEADSRKQGINTWQPVK